MLDEGDLNRLRRLEKENMNDAEVGPLLKYIDVLRDRITALEFDLSAARTESMRLTGRTVESFVLSRLENEMIGPSLSPELCDQAINIIAELRRVRRDLGGGNTIAALVARDNARVHRVAKALCYHENDCKDAEYECPCQYWGEQARVVLAAADGRGHD